MKEIWYSLNELYLVSMKHKNGQLVAIKNHSSFYDYELGEIGIILSLWSPNYYIVHWLRLGFSKIERGDNLKAIRIDNTWLDRFLQENFRR